MHFYNWKWIETVVSPIYPNQIYIAILNSCRYNAQEKKDNILKRVPWLVVT